MGSLIGWRELVGEKLLQFFRKSHPRSRWTRGNRSVSSFGSRGNGGVLERDSGIEERVQVSDWICRILGRYIRASDIGVFCRCARECLNHFWSTLSYYKDSRTGEIRLN